MLIGIGTMLGAAQSAPASGGGGNISIPLSTPLIFVGDSITNVSNAAYSSHRAYRHWFNVYCGGHFYCTPASNQGVGGSTLTEEADSNRYIELREDFWLNQVYEGTAVMLHIGTNDMSNTSATAAIMLADIQNHIDNILALGGIAFLPLVPKSTGNQTDNGPNRDLQKWTEYNAALEALHDPANGVFVLTSVVENLDETTTYLYDGLHFNGNGARLAGYYYAQDIAQYLTGGPILFGDTEPGSNLTSNYNFSGTSGTVSAGAGGSGDVADDFTVFANSTGKSGGSDIGVTTVCSKSTVDIPGVGDGIPCQQIDVTGTATGDGYLALANTVSFTQGFCEFAESFCYIEVSGSTVSDPAGCRSIGLTLGSAGGIFNRNYDSNAGNLTTAFSGIMRTVPISTLKLSFSQVWDIALGLATGSVDVKLKVAQLGANRTEQTAYLTPFNAGADTSGLGNFSNPIGPRPRLNGTPGVGNTLTLQPTTMIGGGFTSQECRVVRDGVTTVATYGQTDNPMTYVQQAGDSGHDLTLEHDYTNSIGTITAVSAAVSVP